MRQVRRGNCEGGVMSLGYVQIRRHAEDWAGQTDLCLRRKFPKTKKRTVVAFKFCFEKEYVNIFIVICCVLVYLLLFKSILSRNQTI